MGKLQDNAKKYSQDKNVFIEGGIWLGKEIIDKLKTAANGFESRVNYNSEDKSSLIAGMYCYSLIEEIMTICGFSAEEKNKIRQQK